MQEKGQAEAGVEQEASGAAGDVAAQVKRPVEAGNARADERRGCGAAVATTGGGKEQHALRGKEADSSCVQRAPVQAEINPRPMAPYASDGNSSAAQRSASGPGKRGVEVDGSVDGSKQDARLARLERLERVASLPPSPASFSRSIDISRSSEDSAALKAASSVKRTASTGASCPRHLGDCCKSYVLEIASIPADASRQSEVVQGEARAAACRAASRCAPLLLRPRLLSCTRGSSHLASANRRHFHKVCFLDREAACQPRGGGCRGGGGWQGRSRSFAGRT